MGLLSLLSSLGSSSSFILSTPLTQRTQETRVTIRFIELLSLLGSLGLSGPIILSTPVTQKTQVTKVTPNSQPELTIFVHPIIIGQIFSCFYLLPPFRMGLVPFHGEADPLFKGDRRPPSQLSFDLGEVNCISAIMPRPIRDKSDQGMGFSQSIQYRFGHRQVRLLAPAPDIVNPSFFALVQHHI